MNMDFAIKLAEVKSKNYASRKGFPELSKEWSIAYNGHFDGQIERLSELESLRTILKRKEGQDESRVAKTTTVEVQFPEGERSKVLQVPMEGSPGTFKTTVTVPSVESVDSFI